MAIPLIAAEKGAQSAERFFAGVLHGLGKPAIERTEVKQGRRLVYREYRAFGYSRCEEFPQPKIPGRIVTVKRGAPRWVVLGGALVGGGVYAQRRGWLGLGGGGGGWLASWLNPLTSPLSGLSYMISGSRAVASALGAAPSAFGTGLQQMSPAQSRKLAAWMQQQQGGH